jgi:predicted transcriptional regulator
MGRVQTMVQLTDELVERLDREAARRGVSRSALIRSALEEFLRHDHEAASADLLWRLDAEERRQGREPWWPAARGGVRGSIGGGE